MEQFKTKSPMFGSPLPKILNSQNLHRPHADLSPYQLLRPPFNSIIKSKNKLTKLLEEKTYCDHTQKVIWELFGMLLQQFI